MDKRENVANSELLVIKPETIERQVAKLCTDRAHNHNSCLECTFLERTVQLFGHANTLQQTKKRIVSEHDEVLAFILAGCAYITERDSILIAVQQLLAFLTARRLIDDFILVAALICYQIKRILENFLAFLFGFFLPFLCSLKAGLRGFFGLTLLRKYRIEKNSVKYITPFLERITKKAAHVIHPIAPAFARVSGILLGQHMRKRGAEPAAHRAG